MHKDSQAKHPSSVSTRVRRAGLALPLLLVLPPAHAAGLGGHEVQSALGQPLRMVVQVTARPDETLDANCFKIHPFTVANDGLPQLTNAQVSLDRRGNQPRLVVSSSRPILDPIVRVSIDVGCDTTLRRDLTLLLDPLPVIETQVEGTAPARPAETTAAAPAPARLAPADEPARAAAIGSAGVPGGGSESSGQGAAPTPAPDRATAAPAPRAARPDDSARKSAAQTRPPRAVSAQERPLAEQLRQRPPRPVAPQQRDRLSISASGPPLETYVGAPITPRLMLSTTLADRSAQPPLSESALSILRQKQARLKAAPTEEDIPSLEAELVVLQKRTAEMRNQLDTVMAQMAALRGPADGAPATQQAAADSGATTPVRSMPPEVQGIRWNWTDPRVLVAGALALIIALLIIGFALWLRRERTDARRAARWNKAPYVPATAPASVSPPPGMSIGTDRDTERLERFTAPADRPPMPDSYAFTPFSTDHAASALGVSDLAQATEKAGVFVTLGRPEQAMDVLRDHIDHEPKPSPMAWLMLLDLYRQTSRRGEFLEVAKRFHTEFNAETPAWDQTSPLHDAGLAAFPHLVGKIRDGWPRHEARAFIEELLYDNRGGSRIGFSLPAFRDLLLLHGIVDEYIAALEVPARTDPWTGVVLAPAAPAPPPHLADVWAAASASAPDQTAPGNAATAQAPPDNATAGRTAPDHAEQPALQLDPALVSTAAQGSSLETNYPVIVEAIVSRWGKPGAADYLGNLIRSSNDVRGPGMSNETMSELVMLHDVALELGDPESRFAAA
ncbi:MAG: hypothetical protein IPO58_16315 [Betaproteobacteria bacterium]|nr:hypothetical protein [Betaproteobacteria bacterium]